MKNISLKCKVILTILPLLFGFIMFYPRAITVVSENQITSNNNGLMTSQDAIFDGLYLNYTFAMSGLGSGFSNFSYSNISGNNYNVYWDMFLGDAIWDENLDSRIISNSGGVYDYGDGNHAPIWIFTNSTLGQIIPIAVDGAGDHDFNVTREYAYNLAGFGSIEVWQLEDLDFPGGIALYEKSTGFLISGFFATNPVFNYTLEIITTNLLLSYTTPDSGILDGLHIAYNFTLSSNPLPLMSNFSFFEDPIGTHNVTWTIIPYGLATSWNEYIADRTMFNTGSGGFNEGSHTPIWIHTNIQINDIVPISVDGVGDHDFKVKRKTIHNLPDFGWIEIWVLEDLANSSSEVWYEKSTGLLIQGTFIFGGENYTLEFVETNAVFTYVDPPSSSDIPGYNHFLLIGFLIVLPIIIIRIKKRK